MSEIEHLFIFCYAICSFLSNYLFMSFFFFSMDLVFVSLLIYNSSLNDRKFKAKHNHMCCKYFFLFFLKSGCIGPKKCLDSEVYQFAP